MMNKRIYCFVILVFFSSLVTAGVNSEKSHANYISVVNHKNHTLVINDQLYHMPINMKVSVFNLKTRKKRQSNRYLLKKGKSVAIKTKVRAEKVYIETITIYEK